MRMSDIRRIPFIFFGYFIVMEIQFCLSIDEFLQLIDEAASVVTIANGMMHLHSKQDMKSSIFFVVFSNRKNWEKMPIIYGV